MSATTQPKYMLDHEWVDEPRRLELLQQLHDPSSIHLLGRTCVDAGWRCLEVGAGRGSIAEWLGRQVGPVGSVLAIDLDVALCADCQASSVDVLVADVLELELPLGSLDLIHTRAVLTHIPEPRRAIERMVSWLAPGGWLVVEEVDWHGSAVGDPSWGALLSAYREAAPTVDWACGRELVHALAVAGLTGVDADVRVDVIHGETHAAEWYALTLVALREAVLAVGVTTDAAIDAELVRLCDPSFCAIGLTFVGAWGRR